MPSPFPGMNPYIERASVWHDFHETLIPAIREELVAQADPRFVVRIDDRVYIHESPDEPRRWIGRPDVGVSASERLETAPGVATIEAPFQVEILDVDEERLSFVEIRDRESWHVIAVIELLSPTNKYEGPYREQYLSKRRHLQMSSTHFVEIDLLRGGPPLPALHRPQCDYSVLVSRWQQRPRADFWPIRLRERLPVIPVPLTQGHADITLDLQSLLHRVYDAAGYANHIYRGEPEPQLSEVDLAWAHALIPVLA